MSKKVLLNYVNTENLKIARENIGYSIFEVANILNKKDNKKEEIKINNFENGETIPTLAQLKKIAETYQIPYLLLLSKNNIERKKEKDTPKDFRKIENKNNPVLKKMIQEMIIKQKNIERIYKEENIKPNQVISLRQNIEDPKNMADFIIKKLDINMDDFRKQKDYKESFNYLKEKIENKNIFVFKTYSHHVAQNRKGNISGISVDDMRGLSLYSEYAPFIIIHRQDAPTANIFTLLHEITHIFRKTSSISNINDSILDFRDDNYDKEEIFCNQVASEILFSGFNFKNYNTAEEIINKARELKVSKKTLFIKLKQLNKINGDIKNIQTDIEKRIEYKKDIKKSGGNFYNIQKDSNSALYTRIIHNAYLEERISPLEAYNLLGMNPEKI